MYAKIIIEPIYDQGALVGWIAKIDDNNCGMGKLPAEAVQDLQDKFARKKLEELFSL